MLRTEQALDMADRHGIDDERPACVELVPLARPAQRSPVAGLVIRPDPSFVAQLIATAAQVPQTRKLRRAAASDALCAYTAHLRTAPGAGCRTRQVV
jgi:hypothetical protein